MPPRRVAALSSRRLPRCPQFLQGGSSLVGRPQSEDRHTRHFSPAGPVFIHPFVIWGHVVAIAVAAPLKVGCCDRDGASNALNLCSCWFAHIGYPQNVGQRIVLLTRFTTCSKPR